MPSYRIFRLKEQVRQSFRTQPHLSGLTAIKPRDYEEPSEPIESTTPYALWHSLQGSDDALQIGDVLEIDSTELRIVKYVGFEEARWFVPEAKPVVEPVVPPEAATAGLQGVQ
jgi:hypothetical protein